MNDERERGRLTRRELLHRTGLVAIASFAPVGCGDSSAPAVTVPVPPGEPLSPPFLTETEMRTLRAFVDRLIPPDDGTIGGDEVGCADAISALLSAFSVDPPHIYAGGPYSDRAGSPVNHFTQFVPLDEYEAAAWRIRIEGSAGRPQYEMNGPTIGLQQIYREGLAVLGEGFASQSRVEQDVAIRGSDPAVQALVDVAFPHCIQFMYGAPEYGGNKNLEGWKFCQFDGDVQPRGYTAEQVEEGPTGLLVELDPGSPMLAVLPLAVSEIAQGLLMQSDGRLSSITRQVQAALRAKEDGRG
jgi:hypothetical protein